MNDDSTQTLPLRWASLAAAAMALLAAHELLAANHGDAAVPVVEPAEQVWVISTRRAPLACTAGATDHQFDYWRLATDGVPTMRGSRPKIGRWVRSDQQAFSATDDPAVPTSVFIHGNRVGLQSSFNTGLATYRQLARQAAERPFRFVIWSWPSDRVQRRIRTDIQVKAARSDLQSLYLAEWIQQVDRDAPITLTGYSFGARIITGALEMLAGGRVAGRSLANPGSAHRGPMRAVLVAAAMNSDWLLPGRRHGQALSQIDRMLITRNCCDPALRWYPLMYGRRGPAALGYSGPAATGRLGQEAEKLDLLNVTCSVGKNHDWFRYLCSGGLQSHMAGYTFAEAPSSGVTAIP